MWTSFHMGHYMPLTWMSFGLDYLVWGMNPAGYHLMTLTFVALGRRWPGLLAAWVYAGLMVLPVSGLVVHAGPQLVADRYSYLAGLGWAVLAGGALRRWGAADAARVHTGRRAAVVGVLIVSVTAMLAALTWQQVQIWRNTETLWTHATAAERSSVAHVNLGVELTRQGRHAEAAEQFQRALAIRPTLAKAHNGLGAALAQQGRHAEAAAHFREALRLEPGLTQARRNLQRLEPGPLGPR